MKILLLSYSNESSIEIIKSLATMNMFEIHGAHWDTFNPGLAYLNKNYIHQVESITSPKTFLQDIWKIVIDNKIDKILITNCKILKVIYDYHQLIGGKDFLSLFVIPNYETLKFCLFKDKLYDRLPDYSPKVWKDLGSLYAESNHSEFFLKPKHGTSGEGGRKVKTHEIKEEDFISNVICEYLPGEEVTVDCYSDRFGNLIDFNVRIRESVRDGITNMGRSVSGKIYEEIGEIIWKIAEEIKVPYLWFAQFKRAKYGPSFDKNGNLLQEKSTPPFKLLEINCRVSGSFGITKLARKNYIQQLGLDLAEQSKDIVIWNRSEYPIKKGPPNNNTTVVARHFNILELNRKKYVFDLDGTICTESRGFYDNAEPIQETIDLVNELWAEGSEIIIHTARGMVRYNNDVAKVYDNYFELTKDQLRKWNVKYDKLILGKPVGTYVDNDAVTPRNLKRERTIVNLNKKITEYNEQTNKLIF